MGRKPKQAIEEKPEVTKDDLIAGEWIKVTQEQLDRLQSEGRLIGYRPDTKEALFK